MSLMLHRAGLLRPSLAAPAPSVPAAFDAGDWSLAPGDEEADVTINALPDDGGAPISDIEYRLDGGTWASSGGTTDFTLEDLTNAQAYDVELRAVNSVGPGAASDTKSVTPASSGDAWNPLSPTSPAVVWIDPSDLSSMWQERTGSPPSTPAVVDNVVGTILNKGSAGGYLRATNDGARPILRLSGGQYYLEFDGSDDRLTSEGNITVGNNVTLAIGVRFTGAQQWRNLGGIGTAANAAGFMIGVSGTNWQTEIWSNSGNRGVAISNSDDTDYVFVGKKNGAAISQTRDAGTPVTNTMVDIVVGPLVFDLGRAAANLSTLNGRVYQAALAAADWTGDDLTSLWTFMGNKQGRTL